MAELFTLPGVGPNAPPGVYGVVNFATGAGVGGNGVKPILLLGNFDNVNGTATANTLYGPTTPVPLQSKQDSINLFGAGFPLQRMTSIAYSVNQNSNPIYAMGITSVGVQATGTIVLSSSGTQSTGNVRVVLGTTIIDTSFGSTDSLATIATRVAANINANTDLPLTAVPVSATITLTAKCKGERGNNIRFGAQITSGTGILVAANAGSASTYTGRVNLGSGTGSDNTNYTAAIAAILASGFAPYYIIPEAGADSIDGYNTGGTGNLIIENLISNLVDVDEAANVGIRQVLIAGSSDTLGNTIATTTNINDPRLEVVALHNSDVVPSELAVRWGCAKAVFQVAPLTPQGVNFDKFGATSKTQPYWTIPAPLDGSAPTQTDINTAVVSGVSLIQVVAPGRTALVKSCTSHFWTGTSTQFDPRIVDSGAVTICDYFLSDLEADLALKYEGCMVADNPAQGVVLGANVVTPDMVALTCKEWVETYGSAQLVDTAKTTFVASRSSVVPSRIELQVNLWVANCLHTLTVQCNQTSVNS